MQSKTLTLTTEVPIDGEAVDRALLRFPPLDPAVLLVVRYLQSQIDALNVRLESSANPPTPSAAAIYGTQVAP